MPATTTCRCGKAQYETRRIARRASRRMPGRDAKLRVYWCGSYWHLTSKPTAAVTAWRTWTTP